MNFKDLLNAVNETPVGFTVLVKMAVSIDEDGKLIPKPSISEDDFVVGIITAHHYQSGNPIVTFRDEDTVFQTELTWKYTYTVVGKTT